MLGASVSLQTELLWNSGLLIMQGGNSATMSVRIELEAVHWTDESIVVEPTAAELRTAMHAQILCDGDARGRAEYDQVGIEQGRCNGFSPDFVGKRDWVPKAGKNVPVPFRKRTSGGYFPAGKFGVIGRQKH